MHIYYFILWLFLVYLYQSYLPYHIYMHTDEYLILNQQLCVKKIRPCQGLLWQNAPSETLDTKKKRRKSNKIQGLEQTKTQNLGL